MIDQTTYPYTLINLLFMVLKKQTILSVCFIECTMYVVIYG